MLYSHDKGHCRFAIDGGFVVTDKYIAVQVGCVQLEWLQMDRLEFHVDGDAVG